MTISIYCVLRSQVASKTRKVESFTAMAARRRCRLSCNLLLGRHNIVPGTSRDQIGTRCHLFWRRSSNNADRADRRLHRPGSRRIWCQTAVWVSLELVWDPAQSEHANTPRHGGTAIIAMIVLWYRKRNRMFATLVPCHITIARRQQHFRFTLRNVDAKSISKHAYRWIDQVASGCERGVRQHSTSTAHFLLFRPSFAATACTGTSVFITGLWTASSPWQLDVAILSPVRTLSYHIPPTHAGKHARGIILVAHVMPKAADNSDNKKMLAC